jgi:hypothetical protein
LRRPRPISFPAALALALALTAAARADDDAWDPGKTSIGFASVYGIGGMRNLVEARIPEPLSLRAILRYELLLQSTASDTLVHSVEANAATLTLGGSFLGRVELGVHWSFYLEKTVTNETSGPGSPTETYRWIPNVDLAAKGGGALDWIDSALDQLAVSPYVVGHVSGGQEIQRLDGYQALEIGLAGTVAFLENRLALHVNVAFTDLNAGALDFRYRLGASVVPVGFREFLLRLASYLDGLSGPPGTTLRVAFAGQALIAGWLGFEISGDYTVFNGRLESGLRDNGSGGFSVGAGVRLTF